MISKEKEYDSRYGMNISQIHSGSGHGYGIAVSINIQKGVKSLEVGAIYQTSENKIAGLFRYSGFTKYDFFCPFIICWLIWKN